MKQKLQHLSRENRKLRRELSRLRSELLRDDLTGLQNARSLREHLESAIHKSRKRGEAPALIFIDIDHFKEINEENGHRAAGYILGQVGCRIAAQIREDDLAFRYGGDEFVVLVSGGRKGALRAGERIRKALARDPFHIEGLSGPRRVMLTASLGIRVIRPGEGANEVLEEADRAMFQAKRNSRNTVVAA